MATHSSVLAWRIPGTGQPGGLPTESDRVGLSRTESDMTEATWQQQQQLGNDRLKVQSQTHLMPKPEQLTIIKYGLLLRGRSELFYT